MAAPVHVLRGACGVCRPRDVRPMELIDRHTGHPGPVRFGCRQIEPVVQVDPHPHPPFVGLEVVTEPSTEEGDEVGVAVRELDDAIGLRSIAGVQSHTGSEERDVVQSGESLASPRLCSVQVGRLRSLQAVRWTSAGWPSSSQPLRWDRDVATPA